MCTLFIRGGVIQYTKVKFWFKIMTVPIIHF